MIKKGLHEGTLKVLEMKFIIIRFEGGKTIIPKGFDRLIIR